MSPAATGLLPALHRIFIPELSEALSEGTSPRHPAACRTGRSSDWGEPCCPRGPGEGACWRPKETALKKAENGPPIVLLLASLPPSGGRPNGQLGPCTCYCTSHVVLWGGGTSGPSSPPSEATPVGPTQGVPFPVVCSLAGLGQPRDWERRGGLGRCSFWNTLGAGEGDLGPVPELLRGDRAV